MAETYHFLLMWIAGLCMIGSVIALFIGKSMPESSSPKAFFVCISIQMFAAVWAATAGGFGASMMVLASVLELVLGFVLLQKPEKK